MPQQLYPYAKVGRPVERVRSAWKVLHVRRCKRANVALVQRTRTFGGEGQTSYAVVRSLRPIVANGTLLNAMEAARSKGRSFCKCRDPEAWHSSLAEAEAKFRFLVRRGGR